MALKDLFRFKGGVKLDSHKSESTGTAIHPVPLPKLLAVPLHQNVGGTPHPIVEVGQKVLKGQKIGDADGWISAAVHAPTSGTVTEIGMFPAAHPSGLLTACVLIEPDGQNHWIERQPIDYKNLAPEYVRHLLQESGVVGMGGAAFPSHAKTQQSHKVPMEALIINGAECEPYITCDDRLMRERATEILLGAGVFRDLLHPQKVIIGIEDNKPEAIEAMRQALREMGAAFSAFEVAVVPTLYPAGGAKQLIRVLTGKEIPAGHRSTDEGVQCFNVATVYAAWRALAHGEPLISRIVTVTGNVGQARNYEVPIGMLMSDLLALSSPQMNTDGIVMGGPMMGFKVPDVQAPVIKATNCLIALSPTLFPPPPPEMPCIRCGKCAEVCPHELQPFEMYWYARAKNFKKTEDYNIGDCIECGCCSYVCPSRIPLVQYFRFAKSELVAQNKEKQAAEQAKARFEFKQFREQREKLEKAEKLAKAAAAQAAKKAAEAAAAQGSLTTPGTETNAAPLIPDPKRAAIEAAMARAAAQREAAKAIAPNTTNTDASPKN